MCSRDPLTRIVRSPSCMHAGDGLTCARALLSLLTRLSLSLSRCFAQGNVSRRLDVLRSHLLPSSSEILMIIQITILRN